MFSNEELAKQLNTGTVKIPDNHKVALVVHVDPVDGKVTATVATNIGKGWQISNQFEWDKEHGMSEGFNISFSK